MTKSKDIDNLKHSTSKSHKIKIVIFSILSIILIIAIAYYVANQQFRDFVNNNILKKQVSENNLSTIEINAEDRPFVFSYDSYICVFSKNRINIYNSDAHLVTDLSVNITSPIVESNGKYFIMAEKGGNDFYVVNNNHLAWQGKVDGDISRISINPNGYVTIIDSNSIYTSRIILFDSKRN